MGLFVTVMGVAGRFYAVGSLILGLGLLFLAFQLYRGRNAFRARRLFMATVVYLSILLALMVFDSGPVRG